MNFVRGQKVECIEDVPKTWSIIKGGVYEVSDIDTNGNIQVNIINRQMYKKERFRTIIRSIDDVIIGMELTHNFKGQVEIVSCNTKANTVTGYEIGYEYKGNTWYTRDIDNFKEYKPKEEKTMQKEQTKYEVIKPFTISDLWNAFEKEHSCPEFQREWGKFMEECIMIDPDNMAEPFESFNSVKDYPVLVNNLHHLEKKGFIIKVEEDVVLKPGMKLKTVSGKIFTVIDTQNNDRDYVLVSDEYLFCVQHNEILKFKGNLGDLNRKLSVYNIPGLQVVK